MGYNPLWNTEIATRKKQLLRSQPFTTSVSAEQDYGYDTFSPGPNDSLEVSDTNFVHLPNQAATVV